MPCCVPLNCNIAQACCPAQPNSRIVMLSVAKRAFSRVPALRWLLLAIVLLAVYQMRVLHLDDRLYYWLTTPAVSQWAPGSLLVAPIRCR